MLLIPCPWCGPRDETEFKYGGQAHLPYPEDPEALTDEAWADFLFMRDNPRGPWSERWMHAAGCRRWFNAVRDTATNRVFGTYRIGEAPPGCPTDGVAPARPRRSRRSTVGAVAVTFDGRAPEAFAGDTLASALLANGVDVVCPSPILGRPRGVIVRRRRGAQRIRRGDRAVVRTRSCRRRWSRWSTISTPWAGAGVGVLADGDDGIAAVRSPARPRRDPRRRWRRRGAATAAVAAASRGDRVLLVERGRARRRAACPVASRC